jgi:hypothetical protein
MTHSQQQPPLHQAANSKPNIQNQPLQNQSKSKSKPKSKSTTPVTHSTIQNPRPTTTPRSANPRPTTTPSKPTPRSAPKPSTQAHAEQTQAISFFLAMENRGRERRTEGEHSEEKEKNGRERKKIGQNEKKKRPVKNNKQTD